MSVYLIKSGRDCGLTVSCKYVGAIMKYQIDIAEENRQGLLKDFTPGVYEAFDAASIIFAAYEEGVKMPARFVIEFQNMVISTFMEQKA